MNEIAAKKLYRDYAAGRGLDALYGPARAGARAHLLTVLTGRTVPKSKAGWNLFRDEIFRLFNVSGNCLAVKESNLRDAVKAFGEAELHAENAAAEERDWKEFHAAGRQADDDEDREAIAPGDERYYRQPGAADR